MCLLKKQQHMRTYEQVTIPAKEIMWKNVNSILGQSQKYVAVTLTYICNHEQWNCPGRLKY